MQTRKKNQIVWTENSTGKDKFAWLLCANRQTHSPEQLLLTQVLPSDCLQQMDRILHETRREWGIPQYCKCELVSKEPANEVLKSKIKGDLVSVMNGNAKLDGTRIKSEPKDSSGIEGERTNGESKETSTLGWLADLALQNQKLAKETTTLEWLADLAHQNQKLANDSDSDSDSDREGFSTLRELLIRPSHRSRSNSPAVSSPKSTAKKSKMDTLDEVISSVIEHSVKKEDDESCSKNETKAVELKHFVRRYKWVQGGREPLPIRIMTLTESRSMYPDTPHFWLCDGKLLRLQDPNNTNNYRLFQDLWKRGQPVIVSDVHKNLDIELWRPESISRDFGDQKNDLVNCLTGNTVPKQPMWKFWEGFTNVSKRLKDEQGQPMSLKLKDWPSRGDFADILPTRFADLMKSLPLSEYTHRYGRLNLTSRLPDIFTKPDLGPKMYNAYGNLQFPDKGTTNLHLDVSDAVNVMVYVGVNQDGDQEQQLKGKIFQVVSKILQFIKKNIFQVLMIHTWFSLNYRRNKGH